MDCVNKNNNLLFFYGIIMYNRGDYVDYNKMRRVTAELLEILNDGLRYGPEITDSMLDKFYNVAVSVKLGGKYDVAFRKRVILMVERLKGRASTSQDVYYELIDIALIPKMVAERLTISERLAGHNISRLFEEVNKKR